MVGWGSVWAGPEGLPRLLVLFVDRGVRSVLPEFFPYFRLQLLQKMSMFVIPRFPILDLVSAPFVRGLSI